MRWCSDLGYFGAWMRLAKVQHLKIVPTNKLFEEIFSHMTHGQLETKWKTLLSSCCLHTSCSAMLLLRPQVPQPVSVVPDVTVGCVLWCCCCGGCSGPCSRLPSGSVFVQWKAAVFSFRHALGGGAGLDDNTDRGAYLNLSRQSQFHINYSLLH